VRFFENSELKWGDDMRDFIRIILYSFACLVATHYCNQVDIEWMAFLVYLRFHFRCQTEMSGILFLLNS